MSCFEAEMWFSKALGVELIYIPIEAGGRVRTPRPA